MIYVDDAAVMFKGKFRYHMIGNSMDELHKFAEKIGVSKCWHHHRSKIPHYDITEDQRKVAIQHGAQAVTSRELVKITRGWLYE